MDRSSNKISIKILLIYPNNTLDEMELIYIHRAFHPKEAKYTFFSSVHGTFSKIEHMTAHKASRNKFKNIEIISSIFSDHEGLNLKTNPKEKKTKTLKIMETE